MSRIDALLVRLTSAVFAACWARRPRYVPRDWAQQVGPEPAPERSPLSVSAHLLEHEPRARSLMDAAARELDEGKGPSPSLHVLHDWLHDQDAPVGKASLSTLVRRLRPLLE